MNDYAAAPVLPSASEDAGRTWSPRDLYALLAVTLVGGVIRLVHLADPNELVFDETYYAKDACWYVNTSSSLCEVNAEGTMVHPPLGKWLLALGIRIFGYDSFGWRIVAMVAGTVTIALLFVLARRVLRSLPGAVLASGLLAIDTLHFVQSRIAMLDIFVPLFGLAGVYFIVRDHDENESRTGGPRPWLIAAGAMGGLATASKWSGVFYLATIVVLAVMFEIRARREEPEVQPDRVDEPHGADRPRGFALGILGLLIAAVLTYSVTYLGRLPGPDDACPDRRGAFPSRLVAQQFCMLDFHRDLASTHSYQSPAWSWLLLKRPVSYFFCAGGDCKPPVAADVYEETFATGSPFVWWSSILALLFVTARWIRRRGGGVAEPVIVLGFALSYLPWLAVGALSDRSAVFLFYLLPALPFMCLALAYVATNIGWSWEAKAAVGLFAAGAFVVFAFYYPLLTKRPIPQKEWDRRIWVFDNCDKPTNAAATTSGTASVSGTATLTDIESIPPVGWCWI